MVALTPALGRPFRSPEILLFKVATNTQIWEGSIVQLVGGLLVAARSGCASNENLSVVGVADQSVDNNPGTAGAKRRLVRMPHNSLFLIATNVVLADANIGSVYDILDVSTLQATAPNSAPASRLMVTEVTRMQWFHLMRAR